MILDYTQLGSWISDQASEYFKKWYSSNTNDYIDDIKEEFDKEIVTCDYESTMINKCHLELTEQGYTPLVLQFERHYLINLYGRVLDEYFII